MAKSRLGWLGPVVVIAGLVIGGLGVWFMIVNKPRAGAVIETINVDPTTRVVIRDESNGDRNFVELQHKAGNAWTVAWQALVPPYAGSANRVGVAFSEIAVAVRVVRGDKAEVFALSRRDGTKLGGVHLGLEHGPIKKDATGPLQFSDARRTYEIVAGDDWNQVVAVDLTIGEPLWKLELGPAPITDGGIQGGNLWLTQGGLKRWFNVFTGKEDRSMNRTGKSWEDVQREAVEAPLQAPKSP